jgi:carboxyl-terminal processing protease
MRGGVRVFIVAMALGAGASPARSAEADQAFAAVKEAFDHIRSDYIDVVDDAKVLRAAIKAMSDALDARSTPGSSPGLGDVEHAFDMIVMTAPIEPEKLADAAIAGMLDSLDPQSQYIDPPKWRQQLAAPQSGSVGLNLARDAGVVRVAGAIENGPADTAGVVAGDTLVAIDHAPITGLALADVVAKLRGPLKSEIVLTLVRGRGKPVDITLVRAPVYQQSVYSGFQDGIGYLLITRLTEQTPPKLKAAIGKIQAATDAAARLRGFVIDLRDNSGGLLEVAVAVARVFLDRGLIATTTARGRETQRFEANAKDLIEGKPIVVLINEHTAAGAEIVASALQLQHRAVVMGARSAGAGTIQTIIPLGDGHGALRLTTSRIATASGSLLEGSGVIPEIAVAQPLTDAAAGSGAAKPPQDAQLQSAMDFLRRGNRL